MSKQERLEKTDKIINRGNKAFDFYIKSLNFAETLLNVTNIAGIIAVLIIIGIFILIASY